MKSGDSASGCYEVSKWAVAVGELVSSLLSRNRLVLVEHRKQVHELCTACREGKIADELGTYDWRAGAIGPSKKWQLQRAGGAGIWLSAVADVPNKFEFGQ
jgi:hypothetical protein